MSALLTVSKRHLLQMFMLLVMASMISALLVGCGGRTNIKSDLGIKGAPDWVNEGTQAVNDKKGRFVQGVGAAPDLGDPSLQRATADNRARAEIARVLSSYMDVALNDYTASASQAEGYVADAAIQQQINSVSKIVLNGAKILGNWRDKRTKMVYSFAELDLKKVQETIKATDSMNQGLKNYLLDQGDAIFDRFSQ